MPFLMTCAFMWGHVPSSGDMCLPHLHVISRIPYNVPAEQEVTDLQHRQLAVCDGEQHGAQRQVAEDLVALMAEVNLHVS